jgi:hypothetical protein
MIEGGHMKDMFAGGSRITPMAGLEKPDMNHGCIGTSFEAQLGRRLRDIYRLPDEMKEPADFRILLAMIAAKYGEKT